MNLFDFLNERLFDNKIKLKIKPKILRLILPRVSISFFNTILIDNVNIPNSIILHEIQHLTERCNYEKYKFKVSFWKTIKFYVGYLMPQAVALFSLLALLNIWFLLFLLFLLPNPILSFYRKNVELRGYYWNWYMGDLVDFTQIFNGWLYYKMDCNHSNNEYYKLMREIHDKLYFSVDINKYFYMYILLKEYKIYKYK